MATKKSRETAPADKIALYDKLISTKPEIERKGDTMPYTSLNGNMFSVVNKDGTVGLRLSSEDRDAFMKKYKNSELVMYGMLMKEYVAIPDQLLKDTKELKKYLDKSYDYAKTLKPKPAKKTETGKKSKKKK